MGDNKTDQAYEAMTRLNRLVSTLNDAIEADAVIYFESQDIVGAQQAPAKVLKILIDDVRLERWRKENV